MVPAIRNILGGFLFSGDDVYKKAGVLSGGERTRLAVARMLLRPSNTLLLDEPTNHLDLDSKEVLLDALADYGGTLIFVSHDRYFVEQLATKIIEVGDGQATMYPGTVRRVSLEQGTTQGAAGARCRPAPRCAAASRRQRAAPGPHPRTQHRCTRLHLPQSYEDRKRESAEQKKRERAVKALKNRIAELEARIAEREKAIKDVEQTMSAPDFYNDHEKSKPVLAQHQALMWEVGELLAQWEMLQGEAEQYRRPYEIRDLDYIFVISASDSRA